MTDSDAGMGYEELGRKYGLRPAGARQVVWKGATGTSEVVGDRATGYRREVSLLRLYDAVRTVLGE